MKLDEFNDELKIASFEFFYWYSRFEYALKENGYIKSGRYKEVFPDWNKFKLEHAIEFSPTQEFSTLREAPPQCQAYRDDRCVWEELILDREETELGQALLILRTIRNNLFHGGKHNHSDWDDPKRNIFLLINGKNLLDYLASISSLESDYARIY
jgi:hypothetical protein